MAIVGNLIDRAAIVVWTFGFSEGIKWEIKQLVSLFNPTRILAYCPLGGLTPIKKEAKWTRIHNELSIYFPKGLPKTIDNSLFMVFDNDWNPRWVKPTGIDSRQSAPAHIIWRSMEQVFNDMGLKVKSNK